ncbi:MAG: hypothetical protein K2Q15_06125 [Burkholderiales bacterium]|nr:hypothetical protein [Burkholderiales bacterium]
MKKDTYLYLDFDGVLHPFGEEAITETGQLLDNPNLFIWVEALESVLDNFENVRIIVSSDWRRLFDDETLIRLLRGLGSRFHGVVESQPQDRYNEILQDAENRNIKKWIAIDDHHSIKEASKSDERLIWCTPDMGIGNIDKQLELRDKLLRLQQ